MKTFIVKYQVVLKDSSQQTRKSMRIHNCHNCFEAKIKLDIFLRKKIENYETMIVKSCKEEINPIADFLGIDDLKKIFRI